MSPTDGGSRTGTETAPPSREILEGALQDINAARALPEGESGRVEGLLRGLEQVLAAADPPDERARDGGRALADLDRLLSEADEPGSTRSIREFLEPIVDRLVDQLLDRPDERLASYGSLRPGEANHHHVADLLGQWREARVAGKLYPDGVPATRGFPGMVWDPEASAVPLEVFESAALPGRWPALDAFEGPGYRRILVTVTLPEGLAVANMYELADPPATPSDPP
ncbi:MAG: gamma-glutamylcyclotransferase [Gemmatimonadota bacterium]|nr:gamma-glutamylcyclotransferase [Gemmatimonadota bacterium]